MLPLGNVCLGAHGGQKAALDLLETELQAAVSHLIWELGTKTKSSARAASTVDC